MSLFHKRARGPIALFAILILVACFVPATLSSTPHGRYRKVVRDLDALERAIEHWCGQHRELPVGLNQLTGSTVLADGLPVDPWGRAYCYRRTPAHSSRYVVWSRGPREDVHEDDIGATIVRTVQGLSAPEVK